MNRSIGIFAVCAMFFLGITASASAQTEKSAFIHRISLEIGDSFYVVPEMVLKHDNIKQSPESLTGAAQSIGLNVRVWRSLNLGVMYLKASASGNGPWEETVPRQSSLPPGPTGFATGRTDWEVRGFMFTAGQTFLKGRIHPGWDIGIGKGTLNARFNGTFHGSDGDGPFETSSKDFTHRNIPFVSAGGKVCIDIQKHIAVCPRFGWNTGWQAGGSLKIKF